MASASRVLIIVENLPVPNDRRVWLEATALRDAGYRVSIISIKGKNATRSREVLEDVHIYRYPAPPVTSGFLSFVWEFLYCWVCTFVLSLLIAFREGFDIIHACNPPETFWLVGLFYKLFGKRFLFDHHDLSPEMYFSRFGKKGMSYRVLLLLERLTFLTADVVVTTNETHRRVAIERGNFPCDKIFIVRSGPDHCILRPMPGDEALKRGKRYMVGYLGVINPQDGVDLLVQIADHVVHHLKRSDVQFVIMGTGDAEMDLREMVHALDLDEYVQFTGWADIPTFARYLASSDVCVDTMPKTAYSDAATLNKILEYMSMARPIVTFDLVESRLSAGEAALYARPGDIQDFSRKVVHLLEDEALRAHMGAIGRERIETELAWQHQIPHLLAAYESLREL